jgi:SSS family transporter
MSADWWVAKRLRGPRVRSIDIVIVVAYLVAMPVLGMLIAGRQRSSSDYFLGNRQLPWWAVCFSVVATETSTLTVISTPAIAYGGKFTFLQLAFGYLIGRIVVAFVLLPRYYAGGLITAYAFLGKRFGATLQGTASATFVITRLLAEGTRLFAGALPIKVILDAYGIHTSYVAIVVLLTACTVIYTYVGGMRAVVWVDAIQLLLYLGGAIATIVVLAGKLPHGWVSTATSTGKFQVLDFTASILTSPYSFVAAVVGGALLSMASHGADQLIVQRLLACRDLRSSQRALIGSGVVVFFQFGLFLLIGTMLWIFYKGASPTSMHQTASGDDLFPTFIIKQLPVGLSGLLIAGILAATMGTLASALNTLSTSTVNDLYQRFTKRKLDDLTVLRHGRTWTLVWAAVFVVFALPFSSTKNPIIEKALGITGYTYGALLGAFFLGLLVRRASQADAVAAFLTTVAVMAFVILGVTFTGAGGKQLPLAYPWYTPVGVAVTLLVGGLLSLRHRAGAPPGDPSDPVVPKAVAGETQAA